MAIAVGQVAPEFSLKDQYDKDVKLSDFSGKKNADLWARFLRIYPKHKVKFIWVKGHAENALFPGRDLWPSVSSLFIRR